jgi:hypothetical protein
VHSSVSLFSSSHPGLSTCQRLTVQPTDILFERSTFCGIKVVIRPPSRSRASPKLCPTVLSGLRGLPKPARSDSGMVGMFFVWRRALREQRHERRTLQAELECSPVKFALSRANRRSDPRVAELCPVGRLNRPISARFHGLASWRASARILVRRLESRSRCLRAWDGGRLRRNTSSTCWAAMMESSTPARPARTLAKVVFG